MEDFLAFHRPISRLDFYIAFREPVTSLDSGAFAFAITGLRQPNEVIMFACATDPGEQQADGALVVRLHSWFPGGLLGEADEDDASAYHDLISHSPTHNTPPTSRISAFAHLSLVRVGNPARPIDLVAVNLEALCTSDILPKIERLMIDVNGYELFSCEPSNAGPMAAPPIPSRVGYPTARQWSSLIQFEQRMIIMRPLRRSPRFVQE
jgi:hypothetical protein